MFFIKNLKFPGRFLVKMRNNLLIGVMLVVFWGQVIKAKTGGKQKKSSTLSAAL